MEETLLAGTAKGMVQYSISQEGVVRFIKVHFVGFSVNMIYCDETTGRWWVGISHRHWGQKLHYSDNNEIPGKQHLFPATKAISYLMGCQLKFVRFGACRVEETRVQANYGWEQILGDFF